MAKAVNKLAVEIHDLADPKIDRVWAKEARKRWAAYKTGRAPTLAYDTVMVKHRRP